LGGAKTKGFFFDERPAPIPISSIEKTFMIQHAPTNRGGFRELLQPKIVQPTEVFAAKLLPKKPPKPTQKAKTLIPLKQYANRKTLVISKQ
jgi:hypothetical protein